MKTRYAINFFIVMFFIVVGVASTFVWAEGLCYSTGFEQPTFMPGQLDLQDEWRNPQKTALILPTHPLSGDQSIRVFGNKLNDLSGLVGTRFSRVFLYNATSKTVDVSVDVQLDGPSTASGSVSNPNDDLISANLDLLLAGELLQPIYIGALALSSSGDVWVFNSAGQYVDNVPVNLGEHHRLGARIDFSKREIQFFVDNVQVTTLLIDLRIATNIFGTGAPAMFAVSDRKLLKRNLYNAYFDNYCVATTDCEIQCLQTE